MKRRFGLFFLVSFFVGSVWSAPPDAPMSSAEFANAAGRGFLLEPETPPISGLPGRAHALGAYYLASHGQTIKEMGFDSVRLRYQVVADVVGEALTNGAPYDDRVLDDMERIVDDLLAKDMAVILTFYGLTEDRAGDFDKMTNWWGFVAERFKDKSHRLAFNYFVEPWRLSATNQARYVDYLDGITEVVRATNPDRICIGYYTTAEDYAMDSDGAATLNPVSPPAGEGKYWLWDLHLLKDDLASNERRCLQALEYSNATKIPFWVGAWDTRNYYVKAYTNASFWGTAKEKWAHTEKLLQRTLQRAGISGEYLMFFDGGTSLYDGDADRDGNGTTNEWMFANVASAISNGFPAIWMNLLENAGFEYGTNAWSMGGATLSVSNGIVGNAALLSAGDVLAQNAKKALEINGSGNYDVLLHGKCASAESVTVRIRLTDDAGDRVAASGTCSLAGSGSWEFFTNRLSVSWSGTLQAASLEVVYNGSSALYLDDLGLTRFHRSNPSFDTAMWPNGHRMERMLEFGSKTVGGQLINVRRRDMESAWSSDARLQQLMDDYNNASDDLERLTALDNEDAYLFSLDPGYPALCWQVHRFFPDALYTNDFVKIGASPGNAYEVELIGKEYWNEGHMPVFSKTSGPAWLSVASDGTISGTPSSSDLGTNTFLLAVDDAIATNSMTLKVVVDSSANGAPTWKRGNSYTTAEDAEFIKYVSWMSNADPDGDVRVFGIVSGPEWLHVGPYNAKLYGTPRQQDVGTVTAVVSVTDNLNPVDVTNIVITVTNVNDAPVFSNDPVDGGTAYTNAPYSGTLNGTATDEDGDAISYAKVSGPAWLSIASGGALSGTPGASDVGTNEWTVSATDVHSASTTAVLRIVVDAANHSPYWKWDPFTQATLVAGSNYVKWIAWRYTDDDGDALSLAKVSGPGWLTVSNPNAGKIEGTPANADAGTNAFVMSVSDGKAPAVEATMYVVVKSYHTAWNEEYALSGVAAGHYADPDADGLNNLTEYVLGADPTNAASGADLLPEGRMVSDAGTWIEYVYRRRKDAAARDLSYRLEVVEDLQSGTWTTNQSTETGTADVDADFESVTNRIAATPTNRFVRLRATIDE